MEKQILLIYAGKEKQKAEQIKTFLKERYIVNIIEDDRLHQKIGYLFALPGYEKSEDATTTSFPFPLMVLPVMTVEDIQALGQQLKAANLNIERKAMLTEHNQKWRFVDLIKEVDEEHQYFMKRNELYQLFQSATKISPDSIEASITPAFQKAVLDAYDTLQQQSASIEAFQSAIDTLLPLYTYIKKNKDAN